MHIYMSSSVHLRVRHFVENVETEVGGLGYAKFIPGGDGDMLWYEAFLIPQMVGPAEVDFEETNGDAWALEKALNDGVLGLADHVWVSWHSHAKLSLGWSTTDEDRIRALRNTGIKHLLSYETNHDRRYIARYDAFDINHGAAVIPHVIMKDVTVGFDPSEELFDTAQQEIDEHVQKKVYQQPPSYGKTVIVSGSRPAGQQTWPRHRTWDHGSGGWTEDREDDRQPTASQLLTAAEQEENGFVIGPEDPEDTILNRFDY